MMDDKLFSYFVALCMGGLKYAIKRQACGMANTV